MTVAEIEALLSHMSDEERRAVLRVLREEHRIPIHAIESEWNTTAEVILEAIHKSPDLTQRGVRGVVAEAIFRTVVVPTLGGWTSIPFEGDLPYDLLLDSSDGQSPVKVQVKNQRRTSGQPKVDAKLSKQYGFTVYVVETQRTRTGKKKAEDGEDKATRPYRFGEFDVLAVCMQPSSGKWEDFIYCPGHLLLARPDQPQLLAVLQPIFTDESHGWTRDFNVAAKMAREHAEASRESATVA